MSSDPKSAATRYVSDLSRMSSAQGQVLTLKRVVVPVGLSVVFLALVGVIVASSQNFIGDDMFIVAIAAIVGGYMAINIGANDVANNMGPAVGGRVLSVSAAIVIAIICETAGALLAGGDVVRTVSNGIISPGESVSSDDFRDLMLAALIAAALWINLATVLSAPVSTTHSIVGGVLGAGVAAAGFDLVNWATMSKIAASWVISPLFGGIIAALILWFIKRNILNVKDRLEASKRWLPILIGLMAFAFTAYMAMKGLTKIWRPTSIEVAIYSIIAFIIAYLGARPYIARRVEGIEDTRKDVNSLFDLPLIAGAALLSFAHGANDVANAVGPLAAIVSTIGNTNEIANSVTIPFWVMAIGAFGIAFGLGLFGPKLIAVVGKKITRLNAPRAYCVALSAAITVLIATTLGLPVSSTHIAVGAVFGVGFLREFLENPNRRMVRPGHKLNATADDAFDSHSHRSIRMLVRRNFAVSIATAWIITVPAAAILGALVYGGLRYL